MGCGSSTAFQEGKTEDGTQTNCKVPTDKVVTKKNSRNKVIPLDNNDNREDLSSSNPVPKSVAFEVILDDHKKKSGLLLSRPPRHLQRLEPLALPQLTPEILAEKQRLADEKRLQQLKKKSSASNKSSRRRKELLKAREFEREQTSNLIQLKEEQLKTADEKRDAKLKEVQDKQRLREERAKRAREKAKRLKDEGEDLDIEVEKDEQYNNDDDADSWLGDNDKEGNQNQRVESGYSSPHKKRDRPQHPPSASTVDSFDTAFTRNPSKALQITQDTDNFFDS